MALHILVVGGGVAGLATAVSLRRAGHRVQVFEESQVSSKDTAGPIVHLGPKSNELLRSWEINATVAKSVHIKEVSRYGLDGTQITEENPQTPGWEYYERSRLHQALLNAAIASTGAGEPVEIHFGAKVVAVDPDAAIITLDDGQTVQVDVLVGADGFHSLIRQNIPTNTTVISAPSKVAVHFSVDVTQFGTNSVVQRFQNQPERYEKWLGNGPELNVYAIEPARLLIDCTLSVNRFEELDSGAVKKEILRTFESSSADFSQLLGAVDLNRIQYWSQSSLPRLDRWTYKRLALVGDAAHPFLPYELPGTSQTLNDALALGTELASDVNVDQVEGRLAAWEIPRKQRVETIQQGERASWLSS